MLWAEEDDGAAAVAPPPVVPVPLSQPQATLTLTAVAVAEVRTLSRVGELVSDGDELPVNVLTVGVLVEWELTVDEELGLAG